MKIYEGANRISVDEYEQYRDFHSGAGAFFLSYSNYSEIHTNPTNFFVHPKVTEFIEKIENVTGYKCPILLSSGSEANEAAIKLAMKINHRKFMIYMPGCYFGRTYLAAMCSENNNYNGYLPNHDSFSSKLQIGAAGYIFETYPSVSLEWEQNLKEISEFCKRDGIITIADETKGGFRTGSLFSFEQKCEPDIVTLSKSLCSGFPVSAVLVKPELYSYCDDQWYTTTSGGHPMGCAIGLDNLKKANSLYPSLKFETNLFPHLKRIFGDRLRMKGKYISITNMNGRGFSKWCMDAGFLVYGRSNFISFFPTLDDEYFDDFVSFLSIDQNKIESFFI